MQKQGDIKWDVIFCGRAKNRLDNILKIKQNIGGHANELLGCV